MVRCATATPKKEQFRPTGLFSSEPTLSAEQIIQLYIARWNIEITFEELRALLGFETQRQWSDRAIERTTPCLCGIFSSVALMAMVRYPHELPIRQTPWYPKAEATFSDALAVVRHDLWSSANYRISPDDPDLLLFPKALALSLFDMACYSTNASSVLHFPHHHPRQDQPAPDQLARPQHLADQQEAEQRGEDRLGGEDERGVRGRGEPLRQRLDAERQAVAKRPVNAAAKRTLPVSAAADRRRAARRRRSGSPPTIWPKVSSSGSWRGEKRPVSRMCAANATAQPNTSRSPGADTEGRLASSTAPARPSPGRRPARHSAAAAGAGPAPRPAGTITTDSPVMKPALAGVVSRSPEVWKP